MNLEAIQIWLDDLLQMKFNSNKFSMGDLSAIDLLYIYMEIYNKFKIRLTIEDINNDCFFFFLKLSKCVLESVGKGTPRCVTTQSSGNIAEMNGIS
jgi:hypothetical protein